MDFKSLFTESPIEATLWSFSVSLQENLAEAVFQTSLFKGLVALFMGFAVAKFFVRASTGRSEGAISSLMATLFCSLLGLIFLGTNATDSFQPQTASGRPWAGVSSVQNGQRYASLKSNTHGLKFYRIFAEGLNGLAAQTSKAVAGVFGDSGYSKSPTLLLQTLHETARHTLDDPEILSTIDSLYETCAKTGTASAQTAFVSLSNQFDLQKANCANMHSKLRSQLDAWARSRISSPGSKLVTFAEAARNNSIMRSIGFDDNESLKNKVIASGVTDYLQNRAQLSNNNVSSAALLENPAQSPMLGTSTWVGLSRMASVGVLMNLTLRPFTGTDYEAADARNDMAALYTKVSVFLPAVRGFAKGILALMFLIASARLAFGSASLLKSWFWCQLLVTAYEPLSTFLYQATMTLTQSPETTQAMAMLKQDPLVLVGAQVIDVYASKIQATYFVLQLGLTALTAAGGLAVFRYQRALGGSLAGNIASKGVSFARNMVLMKGAPAAAAARIGMASGRKNGGAMNS